ncbi:acetylcholinesterase-like isoform X1 [Ornithodoros turicata]|uniref:acetylcholinesterase-like isoform X1 n=1 Tax=Ornithodoros turicata TaxID=34597 RepID=UPI0031395F00
MEEDNAFAQHLIARSLFLEPWFVPVQPCLCEIHWRKPRTEPLYTGVTFNSNGMLQSLRHVVSPGSESPFMSYMVHTFWSRRSAVSPAHDLKHHLSARQLACMLTTLLFVAIMVLVISTILNSTEVESSETSKVYVFLKGRGRVEGSSVPVLKLQARAFLGIRYAAPPVSSNRFRPPTPLVRSIDSQIEDFQMLLPCPQKQRETSEDCLGLNIWTPYSHCKETGEQCKNLTVLFFLHGGLFQFGANSDYDGRYLSVYGHLIVVVPNYRLGTFGFLQYDTVEAPGNVGLMDQHVALMWTQQNIESFGGNPSEIVLIGHEAGAKSVTHLVRKYSGPMNLKRMILLSGSEYTRYGAGGGKAIEVLVQAVCQRHVGKANASALACLRSLPFPSFLDDALPNFFPRFDLTPPDTSVASQNASEVSGMDVLLGYVEDEGSGMIVDLFNTYLKTLRPGNAEPFVFMLRRLGFTLKDAEEIANAYYRGTAGNQRLWKEHMCADILVVCPVQYYAEALARGGNNVVTYYMTRDHSGVGPAQHGYVRNLLFGSPVFHAGSLAAHSLSRNTITYFTNYAKGIVKGIHPKTISEAGYALLFRPFQLAFKGTSGFSLRKKQCDFLRPFFQRHQYKGLLDDNT